MTLDLLSAKALLPEDAQADFLARASELSDAGQQQLFEAIQTAADAGTVGALDVNAVITEVEEADVHRERADELHEEQAEAAADGDWAKARELSEDAEWELAAVDEHGGNVDAQLLQAEADTAHLEWSELHQETANQNADAALDAAAHGDVVHAEMYGDMAADHQVTALDHGDAADQGGTYASHDDASSGADVTAE